MSYGGGGELTVVDKSWIKKTKLASSYRISLCKCKKVFQKLMLVSPFFIKILLLNNADSRQLKQAAHDEKERLENEIRLRQQAERDKKAKEEAERKKKEEEERLKKEEEERKKKEEEERLKKVICLKRFLFLKWEEISSKAQYEFSKVENRNIKMQKLYQ